MKDLLITKKGKTKVTIKAKTDKSEKVFKEQGAENQDIIGKEKDIVGLLRLAITHDLSVDNKVPIKIQPLLAPYQPKFSIKLDKGFSRIDEEMENSKKNFEHLRAIDNFAEKSKQLLYRYFSLPVSDGRAYYQIIKVFKSTVVVKICEGICLYGYMDNVLGEHSIIPLIKAKKLIEGR